MRPRVNQPVRGRTAAAQRAEALCRRAPPGALVAELGTMRGPMCDAAMTMRPDLRWVMIDNWMPMAEQPQRYIDTQDDNALKSPERCLADQTAAYQVAAKHGATVLHMSTTQAAMMLRHKSFHVVFIDADHSYEGVLEDIRFWRHMVKDGFWIGGHDYRNIDPRFKGVDRAVNQSFERKVETDLNYTWWVRL